VYPELAVRDAATGRIDGVRYDELAPMLLNELQKQQQVNATLATEVHQLEAAQATQARELQAAVLALHGSQRND